MHYITRRELNVSTHNGSLREGFLKLWRDTVPCKQDGCCSVIMVNSDTGSCSASKVTSIKKKMDAGVIKFYPGKYQCLVYDCGVTKWVCKRKKNKIVRHHIKEVVEQRTYKTRPTVGLKGGTIEAVHHILIHYDGRCYDRYEHGGLPAEHDEFSED